VAGKACCRRSTSPSSQKIAREEVIAPITINQMKTVGRGKRPQGPWPAQRDSHVRRHKLNRKRAIRRWVSQAGHHVPLKGIVSGGAGRQSQSVDVS